MNLKFRLFQGWPGGACPVPGCGVHTSRSSARTDRVRAQRAEAVQAMIRAIKGEEDPPPPPTKTKPKEAKKAAAAAPPIRTTAARRRRKRSLSPSAMSTTSDSTVASEAR